MLCGPFYLASVILRPLGSAYGRTKTGVKRIRIKNNLTIIYTYTRIGHKHQHLIKATIRQSHNYDCIGRRGIRDLLFHPYMVYPPPLNHWMYFFSRILS